MLENLRVRILKDYKILLASKSPRRRELLSELRIPFTIVNITGIDESYPKDLDAEEVPQYIANHKADAYVRNIKDNEVVITADTLVILGDKIMGKPHGHEEAVKMLKELSGKIHKVVSGVCIAGKDKRITFSTTTEVKFCELCDEDIEYYVNNYLPFDKAGAYGIQEWIGCVAVEWIKGSYYNVVGLPVHRLYEELKHY